MKTKLLILALVIMLSGCASTNYQFGDISKRVAVYCDENQDNLARQVALIAIHQAQPLVPVDGICTLHIE